MNRRLSSQEASVEYGVLGVGFAAWRHLFQKHGLMPELARECAPASVPELCASLSRERQRHISPQRTWFYGTSLRLADTSYLNSMPRRIPRRFPEIGIGGYWQAHTREKTFHFHAETPSPIQAFDDGWCESVRYAAKISADGVRSSSFLRAAGFTLAWSRQQIAGKVYADETTPPLDAQAVKWPAQRFK